MGNVQTAAPMQGAICTVGNHPMFSGFTSPDLKLKSYHVSCSSDRPASYDSPKKNYGGVVLYQRGGKSDWYLNGLHCQTGYILLKDSSGLPNSSLGQVHGGTYKAFFGQGVDESVVAAGFSYYNGKWRYNSGSFNLSCNGYSMRDNEIKWLEKALRNWCDYGIQTTEVKPPLNIYLQKKK
eukprot:16758_1